MLLSMRNTLYIIRHTLSTIAPEVEPIKPHELVEILIDYCGDFEIDKLAAPKYVYNLRNTYATDVYDIIYRELWLMLNDFLPSWDFEVAEYNDISLYLYGGYYDEEDDTLRLPVFVK